MDILAPAFSKIRYAPGGGVIVIRGILFAGGSIWTTTGLLENDSIIFDGIIYDGIISQNDSIICDSIIFDSIILIVSF